MERRMCVSCRFFLHSSSVSLGRCGHPDRQFNGVTPLVRSGELRCRRSFEHDDWLPAMIGRDSAGVDILLSERPAPIRESWLDLPFTEPDNLPEQLSRS